MSTNEHLIKGLRLMARKQNVIEDTHGNLSVRCSPALWPNSFLIKPSGVEYDEVYAGSCCSISDGLQVIRTGLRPSVDAPLHAGIYAQHLWVNSICHTHSPYATAFAIARKDISVSCTEHADYFGGPIRWLPFMDLEEPWASGVVEGQFAYLLADHGVLVCSPSHDPSHAVSLACAVEASAKKHHLTLNLSGSHSTSLTRDVVERWHDRYQKRYGQGAK